MSGNAQSEPLVPSSAGKDRLSLEALQTIVGAKNPQVQLQDNFDPPIDLSDCIACGLNGWDPGS